jgi:hypothetical protein
MTSQTGFLKCVAPFRVQIENCCQNKLTLAVNFTILVVDGKQMGLKSIVGLSLTVTGSLRAGVVSISFINYFLRKFILSKILSKASCCLKGVINNTLQIPLSLLVLTAGYLFVDLHTIRS